MFDNNNNNNNNSDSDCYNYNLFQNSNRVSQVCELCIDTTE